MKHLDQAVSINIVLVFSALMMAAAANATTAGEGKSTAGKHGISAPATNTTATGFQVNQTRSASAVPESAPLLVMIGALLAVLLVRAKSYNTK